MHHRLAATLVPLALLLSACCFCGDDGPTCRSTVRYVGGTFSKGSPFIAHGTASTEKDAIRNACRDYCITADPDFDAKYTEWVNLPENKDHRDSYKDDPRKGKEWSLYGNNSLSRERDLCADRCADHATANQHSFSHDTTCTAPPP